jgi:hypothetical protein
VAIIEGMPADAGAAPAAESAGREGPTGEAGGQRQHEFDGEVDFIGPDRAVGWARDAANPQARLTVWLEVGGAIVGHTRADIFRPDLIEAGKGDGRYGFDLPLSGSGPGDEDEFRCLLSAAPFALPQFPASRLPPSPAAGNLASPVFIVGPPRAGTTALAVALRQAGYFGYDEGHLLNLLSPAARLVEEHFSENRAGVSTQLLSCVDRDRLIDGIVRLVAKFQLEHTPNQPWYDKTPGVHMIRSIGLLRRAWPQAAFVFAKRRGIENIVSRMKKFPATGFAQHCAFWAEEMAAWREVRDSGIRKIEVDQYDLAHRPVLMAVRLGIFLGLSREQMGVFTGELMGGRWERTDDKSTTRVLSLDTCGWTREQIEIFRATCGAEMDAYGYTFDERYRIA